MIKIYPYETKKIPSERILLLIRITPIYTYHLQSTLTGLKLGKLKMIDDLFVIYAFQIN